MSKKYKKDFIETFIFRVDFDEVQSVNKLSEITDFIKNEYKLQYVEERKINRGDIEIGNDASDFKIKNTLPLVQNYISDFNGFEKIIVSQENFIYESIKYKGFEHVYKLITEVLKKLKDVCGVEQYNKFGMRYINNISLGSVDDVYNWSGYITETMLPNISLFDTDSVLQVIQITDIKDKKYSNIYYHIQNGIWNINNPADLINKNYIIDIDAVSKAPEEYEGIDERIHNIHEKIEELFEKFIEAELRRSMGEEND